MGVAFERNGVARSRLVRACLLAWLFAVAPMPAGARSAEEAPPAITADAPLDDARAELARRLHERERMRQAAVDVLLFGAPSGAASAFRGASGSIDDPDVTHSIGGPRPPGSARSRAPGSQPAPDDLARLFDPVPLGTPRPLFSAR
jgi:hypothetical protein